jgi:lipopolysaccharide biosynthesis glycosyltransferase
MIATGTFPNLPILMISDDAEVFEDEFIKQVVDVKRLVTAGDKEDFRRVMADKVKDVYRLDWIAKYTFLKWLMYDNFGFRTLVYIDSDMVFTSKGGSFLDKHKGVDFVCCPMFPLKEPLEAEFQDGRLRDINVPYPVEPSDYYRFLYSFIHRKQSLSTARINSGIQVIGERLLTSTFRSALLELAASKPYPNEQSVMTAFFKKNRTYTTEFASPVYNFKSSFLDRMPVVQGMDILKHVVNLHYIGARKPWMKPPAAPSGLAHMIWWKYAVEVSKRRALFGLKKGDLDIPTGEDEAPDDKDDG